MSDWKSYDAAANAHEELRVPVYFAPPARDLAARMAFEGARLALDVGTGSGIVARAAAPCSAVVGVDPSLEMLRIARRNGVVRVAAAYAPGLPFADAVFDRVTASFVLSHVASYEEALRDMARVLKPGGLLGMTSWSARGSEYHDLWQSLLERFVDAAELRTANAEALPWEDWLAVPRNVRAALSEAGLRQVTVEEIEYPIAMTIDRFLTMRETSTSARYAQGAAGPAAWERFRDAAAFEFRRRFHDPIDHTHRALIATGRK